MKLDHLKAVDYELSELLALTEIANPDYSMLKKMQYLIRGMIKTLEDK